MDPVTLLTSLVSLDIGKTLTDVASKAIFEKIKNFISFSENNNFVPIELKELHGKDFNDGINYLVYAENCKESPNSFEYIKTAIEKFTSAIYLEEYERLAIAYMGLIFCFHMIGDFNNAKLNLEKFSKANIIKDSSLGKGGILGTTKMTFKLPSLLKAIPAIIFDREALIFLNKLKSTYGDSSDIFKDESFMEFLITLNYKHNLFGNNSDKANKILSRYVNILKLQKKSLELAKQYDQYDAMLVSERLKMYWNSLK